MGVAATYSWPTDWGIPNVLWPAAAAYIARSCLPLLAGISQYAKRLGLGQVLLRKTRQFTKSCRYIQCAACRGDDGSMNRRTLSLEDMLLTTAFTAIVHFDTAVENRVAVVHGWAFRRVGLSVSYGSQCSYNGINGHAESPVVCQRFAGGEPLAGLQLLARDFVGAATSTSALTQSPRPRIAP